MKLSDQEIDRREQQIPELAGKATRQAYERAVASGHPVTVVIGDELVRVQITPEGVEEQSILRAIKTRRVTSRHFRLS
ncbi:hypothetical protein EXU85_19745 [Spirosoma sp. KCTC 42546]|uniref:hypothetical protein n=1 Tax=Spirosoma sp. KCTC 42546 TaxID=2520506 RepID=UPI00115785A4|nr:hypothetical protein [Spirosoma sp. KCTC 42546]QDK80719.1 hypothetical protein EXU85_19745 [Spirosoma sp. KCTC 42546]